MNRLLRNGQRLTLDEHRELAKHIRAIQYSMRSIRGILSGRALVRYTDHLADATSLPPRLGTVRSMLEDELFRAYPNEGTLDWYYGEKPAGYRGPLELTKHEAWLASGALATLAAEREHRPDALLPEEWQAAAVLERKIDQHYGFSRVAGA